MLTRRAAVVSTATLSLVALVCGLACVIAPRWTRHVGLDVWNMPSLCEASQAADTEGEELRAKREQLAQQMEAAEHVAARLIEGTVTLAHAVDELEPLLRNRAGFDVICEHEYRVPTRRHGIARYAIAKVEFLLLDEPSRWMIVSSRLEAEYAALK